MTAMSRAESPRRVTTNAFSPAFLAAGLSLQNAIKSAEQTPTISQKK
jgi:hypothetical protein